jgi:nitrogen regulatory protein PII
VTVVKDDQKDSVVEAIIESARSGNIGDGKIFVSSVGEVIRVRTGDRNEDAL